MEGKMKNEKVSVNINDDKLAAIDLLVEEGLVANRSAFINEAIDLLIDKNQRTIDGIIKQKDLNFSANQWFLGLTSMDSEYLRQFVRRGVKLSLKGFGSLYVNKDVDAELIENAVELISKKIKIHASEEQLAAFKDKIK